MQPEVQAKVGPALCPLSAEGIKPHVQGWAKVALQLWVHKTECITVLLLTNHCIVFSTQEAVGLVSPAPVYTLLS